MQLINGRWITRERNGISYVVWRLVKHFQLSLEVCHQLKTDATSLTLWTNGCSCPLTIIRRSILVDIIRKWRLVVVVVVIIVVLISWMIISHRCISGERERTDEFKLVSNGFHDLEDEIESIRWLSRAKNQSFDVDSIDHVAHGWGVFMWSFRIRFSVSLGIL